MRSAGFPVGLDLQGNATVGIPVTVEEEPPAQVGTEIGDEESGHAETAPLRHVHQLVGEEPIVAGGCPAKRDQWADGDGGGAWGNRPTHPAPVITVALDAHGRGV